MSAETTPQAPNPVGHVIANYMVRGCEYDGNNRWIGADIMLDVEDVGLFSVRAVTKQAWLDEERLQMFSDLERLKPDDFDDMNKLEYRDPFILNDTVITDEVLDLKLRNRVVLKDLADSLWRITPDDEDDNDSVE